jgi:hypothetical protein
MKDGYDTDVLVAGSGPEAVPQRSSSPLTA